MYYTSMLVLAAVAIAMSIIMVQVQLTETCSYQLLNLETQFPDAKVNKCSQYSDLSTGSKNYYARLLGIVYGYYLNSNLSYIHLLTHRY